MHFSVDIFESTCIIDSINQYNNYLDANICFIQFSVDIFEYILIKFN